MNLSHESFKSEILLVEPMDDPKPKAMSPSNTLPLRGSKKYM